MTRTILALGLALNFAAMPLMAAAAPTSFLWGGGKKESVPNGPIAPSFAPAADGFDRYADGPVVEPDPGVLPPTSSYAGDEIELDLFEARLRRAREVAEWMDRVAHAVAAARRSAAAPDDSFLGAKSKKFMATPEDRFAEKWSADDKLLGADKRLLDATKEPMVDELALLEEAVRTRVAAIIAAAPTDAELSPTALSLPVADLGRALVGLTVLESPAIGATNPWGEPCETTVLRDVGTSSERTTLRRSPLIDFFEEVARPNDRTAMSQAVFALSRVQAGMRCLNGSDLSALETAYARALTEILLRLHDGDHGLAARALWDHALPVSLLFFEAVKAYKKPATLALLRLPADFWGGLPASDHRTELPVTPFQDTLAHRLYCAAPNGALTLDRFGIWAPDWTSDGRLQRVAGRFDGHTAWPCDILRSFTELDRLGEGDCPLTEMVQNNMICRSPRTCAARLRVRPLAGAPGRGSTGGFGSAGPFGSGVGGSFGPGPARPGVGNAAPSLLGPGSRPGTPGSRFSHFGIDRASYSDDVCDSAPAGGGAAAPDTCAGPPLRNGRGTFSPDPEMDALMRCTLDVLADDTGRPIRPGPTAEIRGARSPFCQVTGAVGHQGEDDTEAGEDSTSTDDESGESEDGASGRSAEEQREDQELALEEFGSEGFARRLLTAIERNSPSGSMNPDGHARQARVEAVAEGAAAATREGRLEFRSGPTTHCTGHDVQGCHHREETGRDVITIDYDQISSDCAGNADCIDDRVDDVMMHELVHYAIQVLANPPSSLSQDRAFFTTAGESYVNGSARERYHHAVTDRLRLQCNPEDPMCGRACGMEDSIFTRMESCVEQSRAGGGSIDPRCTVDWCGEEEDFFAAGLMSASCFELRDVPGDNPICRMVTCGQETALSGPYAQCCGVGPGGSGGGGGGSVPPGCGPNEQPRPGQRCGDFGGPPAPGS